MNDYQNSHSFKGIYLKVGMRQFIDCNIFLFHENFILLVNIKYFINILNVYSNYQQLNNKHVIH